jgi:two-component system OmpR family sensor kinase
VSPFSGLRLRITLLVAGVVAFCLAAGFVAVYRGTATRLGEGTDRGLREDMAAMRAAVPARSSAQIDRAARDYISRQGLRATRHVLFVVPPGRTPITNEPELLNTGAGADADDSPRQLHEEAEDARAVLRAPAGLTKRVLPGVGSVRLLVSTAPTADGTARFGVAEPTAPAERAESTVKNAFLLAGALGMLAALVGGVLVASRIAAPLRRMARVAARVDAGDLSPRMELGGPHDEVRVLAHSFDQMLERLEGAFARQNAFVADASHELRTPLTIARGQLEVLAMSDDPSPEEIRHVERIVRTEIDRMARLVEDLLLLAHAGEDGFLRPEPIDLPEFLTGIADGMRPTVADRRLELGAIPPIVLDADPDRMAQALRNLLSNAVAHIEPGGLARLSAEARGDRVALIVDDDGPGIPAEERERIFDRFARLDASRARDGGGAGLGLSIVKVIAAAHGGAVWAERSPEGGARFVLELRTAPGAPGRGPTARARRPGTSPRAGSAPRG